MSHDVLLAHAAAPLLENIHRQLFPIGTNSSSDAITVYGCHDITLYWLLHVLGAPLVTDKTLTTWPDYGDPHTPYIYE